VDGMVRVGVIGTGFGKRCVRAFGAHPRATVTAVCSRDAGRAARGAAESGIPHASGDLPARSAPPPAGACGCLHTPRPGYHPRP
jgi:predicted dehydrogenase